MVGTSTTGLGNASRAAAIPLRVLISMGTDGVAMPVRLGADACLVDVTTALRS
jgi:hypothetical protein